MILYFSEHNRIARELKIKLENEGFFQAFSPTEKDECIYQESRRILIAEVLFAMKYKFNNISFSKVPEYCLPRILANCSGTKDDARLWAEHWKWSDKIQPENRPKS